MEDKFASIDIHSMPLDDYIELLKFLKGIGYHTWQTEGSESFFVGSQASDEEAEEWGKKFEALKGKVVDKEWEYRFSALPKDIENISEKVAKELHRGQRT